MSIACVNSRHDNVIVVSVACINISHGNVIIVVGVAFINSGQDSVIGG